MKNVFVAMTAGAIFVAGAVAQEEHGPIFEKMVPQLRVMGLQGSMMGHTVKGAPYSGVEITEQTQMLADGTRIHNESQTQVYRDSEGRMRRETPNEITIWDPVANASWVLNPKAQTARKLPMGNFVFTTNRTPNGEVATYTYSARASIAEGPVRHEEVRLVEGKLSEARAAAEAKLTEAKLKAEVESRMRTAGGSAGMMVATAGPANAEVMKKLMVAREKMNSETLGKKMIEGVNAEGTRMTSTIEAGAIGNDRAIQSVTERWFSPDLQTLILSRSTDPRSGEEVFKLVNVNRSEPAGYLFQVPAGYQVVEMK